MGLKTNGLRMLPSLAFHILCIYCRRNVGPNELKNVSVLIKVTYI